MLAKMQKLPMTDLADRSLATLEAGAAAYGVLNIQQGDLPLAHATFGMIGQCHFEGLLWVFLP
jgi:hypothetical protein